MSLISLSSSLPSYIPTSFFLRSSLISFKKLLTLKPAVPKLSLECKVDTESSESSSSVLYLLFVSFFFSFFFFFFFFFFSPRPLPEDESSSSSSSPLLELEEDELESELDGPGLPLLTLPPDLDSQVTFCFSFPLDLVL